MQKGMLLNNFCNCFISLFVNHPLCSVSKEWPNRSLLQSKYASLHVGHKARHVRLALQTYCQSQGSFHDYICVASITSLLTEGNLSRESLWLFSKTTLHSSLQAFTFFGRRSWKPPGLSPAQNKLNTTRDCLRLVHLSLVNFRVCNISGHLCQCLAIQFFLTRIFFADFCVHCPLSFHCSSWEDSASVFFINTYRAMNREITSPSGRFCSRLSKTSLSSTVGLTVLFYGTITQHNMAYREQKRNAKWSGQSKSVWMNLCALCSTLLLLVILKGSFLTPLGSLHWRALTLNFCCPVPLQSNQSWKQW